VEAPGVEEPEENAFKHQWEAFLRHVAAGEPFEQTLRWGARGALLAERALQSSAERRWVDMPAHGATDGDADGGRDGAGGVGSAGSTGSATP
jgi:hypothetical protein